MASKLYLDFETRSVLDIKTTGSWKYVCHPSTEVLCVAISVDGKKPSVFHGKEELVHVGTLLYGLHIQKEPTTLVAHSAHFEYAVWNHICTRKYGWPSAYNPSQWSCTLSRAAMCGLPLSLEHLGSALGIHKPKDLMGRHAMLKLCKPAGYDPLDHSPYYNEDPALYRTLYDYCARDVEAEIEADRLLPALPPAEKELWDIDLLINAGGIAVDVENAQKARKIAGVISDSLNAKLLHLTKGSVDAASRVAAIKRFLEANGVAVDSLDKNSVSGLLANPHISPIVKEVLNIRRQVGKSSTAKYTAIVNTAGEDGRVRGTMQYHGAATGRWSGRLLQVHNLPRGLDEKAQDEAISAISSCADNPDLFLLQYGDEAMDTLAGSVRGMIVAPPGKKLVVADYSAIEARVLLWLAGDKVALEKYRYGVDLYLDMAQYVYKRESMTKEKNKRERAIGKALVLGAGYGLGHKKFVVYCQASGIEGITEELAKSAIRTYREKYKSVVSLWYATEAAAREAIKTPGKVMSVADGKIAYGMSKDRRFLCCRLPSGRHIRYYRPSLRIIETPYGEKEEVHYFAAGVNGKLEEQKAYGGLFVENFTQAVARDFMTHGMKNVWRERELYTMTFTCHDEVTAETEKGTVQKFIKLLCDLPDWGKDCPITAEGFECKRYRK